MTQIAGEATSGSRRIGVLISGRGSNLKAMIDAIDEGRLQAQIGVVIANKQDAAGLEHARRASVDTLVLDHQDKAKFATREDYDKELVRQLNSRNVQLICLAGFMRLLSPVFIEAFPNAVLNIHPSLLPAFPGMNAQYQAWEHGAKVSGVTVHLVNAELDGGPIVLQETVPVLDSDDADTLAARILEKEHDLYPRAIAKVLTGRWRLD
ncbi:MAG TPA: phosphoribosylglycinamide formyltransferase, partial [Vicinamibacterales bacterium]|nr:phosphoribosylglycinamide formyltransferase [Vicinamibacterales bacterium]